jgi:hypothetical protein
MLSEELFERDEDAYIDAATGLVMKAGRGAVPGVVRQIALNHLQDVLQRSGFGGRFDAWATDLDEAVCTAYLIAAAEQWDVEELDELLDECMEELNDLREAVGSDRVERDDLNTWLSILLIGFAHEGDEMDPLLEYVEEQGAWERIDSLRPTFEMIGAHLADPAPREKESWQAFNHFAWRDGIFMALLDKAGVFGEAKPGALTLAEGDRPLSAELYERDTQAYLLKAGELSSTTAHRVPDVARELYWHLIEPMLRDFKAAPDLRALGRRRPRSRPSADGRRAAAADRGTRQQAGRAAPARPRVPDPQRCLRRPRRHGLVRASGGNGQGLRRVGEAFRNEPVHAHRSFPARADQAPAQGQDRGGVPNLVRPWRDDRPARSARRGAADDAGAPLS